MLDMWSLWDEKKSLVLSMPAILGATEDYAEKKRWVEKQQVREREYLILLDKVQKSAETHQGQWR